MKGLGRYCLLQLAAFFLVKFSLHGVFWQVKYLIIKGLSHLLSNKMEIYVPYRVIKMIGNKVVRHLIFHCFLKC